MMNVRDKQTIQYSVHILQSCDDDDDEKSRPRVPAPEEETGDLVKKLTTEHYTLGHLAR